MSATLQTQSSQAVGPVFDRGEEIGFVTLMLAGMLCGVPVLAVREVVTNSKIVRVPLAPAEIAGNINLRGRIVTAIDTRSRLGLDQAPAAAERVALVAEANGALYALLIDQVLEVLSLPADQIEELPVNFGAAWRTYSKGVHRLADRLMIVLDLQALLSFQP
ncbi:chemotaxis protein CheW [Acetobacteraceae bacterium KSS8]|uniref:Chemotaxis protein CheW n=1 Tax=Endosaccharibacter trunci TaxID=2812733 RepID=A0ABT1W4N9_9PROT|nr:chemotaxis protein CheW [Acetobacteraceae bacterium KSS8]